MAYLATWAVFIDGEGLDPREVAKRAEKHSQDPNHSTWKVLDLDSGRVTVVDLSEDRIIDFVRD